MAWMNEQSARFMWNLLGPILDVDGMFHQNEHGSFIQVRVNLDIRNMIPRGTSIQKNDVNWPIVFRYERLHIFCYYCGFLDHVV